MRFAIMGSGGLGGFFGALLVRAGEEVGFVARGDHLVALRENGLRVESARGDMHIEPVHATDNPAEIGPVDYVLFTVKLWDTGTAAEACRVLLGPETAVLTLQNGVEAPHRIAAVLGNGRVLGGATYVPSAIAAPGVIRHTGVDANILFGELDGRRTARAEALHSILENAGIEATVSHDITRTLWEKFVFLVASSGVTSATGLTYGPIREDPETRAMFRDAMAEAATIATAKGIGIAADTIEKGMAFLDRAPPEMTSSMARDLARGNPLELEWFAGAVRRFGRELGLPTPVNDRIHAAVVGKSGQA